MKHDLFPAGTYKDIRLQDKLGELVREIKLRKHVYPRLVGIGKLNCVTADKRILIMQAVLEDYRDPRLAMLEKLLEEWSEQDVWQHCPDLDARTRKALGLHER